MNTSSTIQAIYKNVANLSYAEIRSGIETALSGLTIAQMKKVALELDWFVWGNKASIVECFVRRPAELKGTMDRPWIS